MARLLTPQSDLTRCLLAMIEGVAWGDWPVLAAVGRPKGSNRVTLYLSRKVEDATDAELEALMLHEASHLVFGHLARGYNAEGEGEPDPAKMQAWGIATDCVVHHQPELDKLVERLDAVAQQHYGSEARSMTFERVGLPPMPAELAYEELLKRQQAQGGPGGSGCGRHQFLREMGLESELEPADGFKLQCEYDKALGGLGASRHGAAGRSLLADLPPPPPWIQEVLHRLTDYCARVRTRSWRREHRHLPGTLPGRGMQRQYPSAVFMVDASGSMSHDQLKQILGAVVGTPELAESTVRVFSDWVSAAPLPVSAPDAVVAEVAKHGGGTLIRAAAEAVEDAPCVVWLTDACSADGLPEPRPDWTWVVWEGGGEPVVREQPRG